MATTLNLTWTDPRWWSAALSGGLFILVLFLATAAVKRQLVHFHLSRGKSLQRWEADQEQWAAYQKRWGSALMSQLVTWILLYAVILAVIDRTGGFFNSLMRYGIFALLVLGPFAAATALLTRLRPTVYTMTESGVGSLSWSLFGVRASSGVTDSAFRPWSNISGYYWREGDLVLVTKRSLLASDRFTMMVPTGARRNIEEILHQRGLTKAAKDSRASREAKPRAQARKR